MNGLEFWFGIQWYICGIYREWETTKKIQVKSYEFGLYCSTWMVGICSFCCYRFLGKIELAILTVS